MQACTTPGKDPSRSPISLVFHNNELACFAGHGPHALNYSMPDYFVKIGPRFFHRTIGTRTQKQIAGQGNRRHGGKNETETFSGELIPRRFVEGA
jgi:hypothetical protein